MISVCVPTYNGEKYIYEQLLSILSQINYEDEILISDDTYQLIKSDFLCAPKTPIYLKGIQGAVKTWQVMEKYTGNKT